MKQFGIALRRLAQAGGVSVTKNEFVMMGGNSAQWLSLHKQVTRKRFVEVDREEGEGYHGSSKKRITLLPHLGSLGLDRIAAFTDLYVFTEV